MPRPSQLPPRCPPPSMGPLPTHNTDSTAHASDELRQHIFPSQFKEQPVWVDDLLGDWGRGTKLTPLRRSVSDPVAFLEESSMFDFSSFPIDDEIPDLNGFKIEDCMGKTEACTGLESGCVYGPNSPRKMKDLTESESSMVSAIFESVNRNPFQYLSVNPPTSSDVNLSDVKAEGNAASGNLDSEKGLRRHTGQRSRVRKLQYIAELERTVNVFQALEADLAAKVATLFQQRAVLSIENSTLKQKISSLRKEKLIKDGQYQSLKNEVKKLKASGSHHRKTRSSSCFPLGTAIPETSESSWRMIDFGKLGLGDSTIPLRDGFKS